MAQRTLKTRWRFDVFPNGKMDMATLASITKIQQQIGHEPNGDLDAETWDAIFQAAPQ